VCGPTIWNSLPPDICTLDLYHSFRQSLKSHLFCEAFNILSYWLTLRGIVVLFICRLGTTNMNTSCRYSANFIRCQYVSAFDTSWQPWNCDHYQARRLRILPTIASSLLNPGGRHSDQWNNPFASHNAATTASRLRWQIIHSSQSACMERPSCYHLQHRADNGHFLKTSQNRFVYWFTRSRRIRDILILLRRL